MAGAARVEKDALLRLPEELWPLIFRFLPAEVLVEKVAGTGPAAFTTVEHTPVARLRIWKEWGTWEAACGAEDAAPEGGGDGALLFGVGTLGGEDCDRWGVVFGAAV